MTTRRAAIAAFALGFGVGATLHRRGCHEAQVRISRVMLAQHGYITTLEEQLAHREQVSTELKSKINDAFEFGRLVQHEYGDEP